MDIISEGVIEVKVGTGGSRGTSGFASTVSRMGQVLARADGGQRGYNCYVDV